MKKVILISMALVTIGIANAQNAEFGLKGGLNISRFNGDTGGMDLKSKVGFNIGVFAAIRLSEKITLQPELLYSTQGVKAVWQPGIFFSPQRIKATNTSAKVNSGFFPGEVQYKLSYINLPIMMKFYVVDKFNIEAGPQIGFLTSAKTSSKMDGSNSPTVDKDVKDSFKSVDLNLNLGIGYDFIKKFSAGIRYSLGLSNIGDSVLGNNSKNQNSVFSLAVAYKL